MFRKPPKSIGALHSDIIWDSNINFWTQWHCALNINLDNTDSIMYWYSATETPVFPLDETPPSPIDKLYGIHYGSKHNRDFKNNSSFSLIETFRIVKPTLVKTSVPHSVENTDTKDRWCLSLRFKNNPSYYECLDKLKDWI
jgi:hypothetical protein